MVEYVDSKTKIKIICPEHGVFEQDVYSHKSGRNCPKCAGTGTKLTQEEVISDFKKVHGDKYDYSLVEYISNDNEVIIKCKIHGEFKQKPYDHLSSILGCPTCGKEKSSSSRRMTTETFVQKAREIHNDKYDYSSSEYKSSRTPIIIICKIEQFKFFKEIKIYFILIYFLCSSVCFYYSFDASFPPRSILTRSLNGDLFRVTPQLHV